MTKMGQDHTPPPAVRTPYGPRPLGALIPRVARSAFRVASPAIAQVLADWPAIVGPMLAAVSTPRRLVRSTLTIACAGSVAIELQHYAPELMQRINACLGRTTVQALLFSQATLSARAAVAPTNPAPPPWIASAADSAVADLGDGVLRDSLAALGRAILASGAAGGKSSTA